MPPTYRVILSPRTFAHLDEILAHIGQNSPTNAAATIDRLWEAMNGLADLPHRYSIVQGRHRPATAVRRMPVPPYLVYYRVLEPLHVVRIITVRQGARRQPRRFD